MTSVGYNEEASTTPASLGRISDAKRIGRIFAAGTIGLFIIFGPACGQVFGLHSIFLREWIMFSGAGIGVVKGDFMARAPGSADVHLTPLQVLGLERYPSAPPDEFSYLVFSDDDLRTFAKLTCSSKPGMSVAFSGSVGTRQGWRPVQVQDVCSLPVASRPGSVDRQAQR